MQHLAIVNANLQNPNVTFKKNYFIRSYIASCACFHCAAEFVIVLFRAYDKNIQDWWWISVLSEPNPTQSGIIVDFRHRIRFDLDWNSQNQNLPPILRPWIRRKTNANTAVHTFTHGVYSILYFKHQDRAHLNLIT